MSLQFSNKKLRRSQKSAILGQWGSKKFYMIVFYIFAFWMIYHRSNDAIMYSTAESSAAAAAINTQQQHPPSAISTTLQSTNSYNASRLCHQNPYNNKLEESLEAIASSVDEFMSQLPRLYEKAKSAQIRKKHRRFFPFHPRATCTAIDCIGGDCGLDTSKIMCGAKELKDGCIIYSIGGNNWWEFEQDLLVKTPCHIHTFDCTGPADRFEKPGNGRLHFHHVCLGPTAEPAAVDDPKCASGYFENHPGKCGETWTLLEMQQRLHHNRIDLFKMDIEGFEWPMFESWPILEDQKRSEELSLPMQILVEVHYKTQFEALVDENTTGAFPLFEFKHPHHMVDLSAHLMNMGYAVQVRDDNQRCKHCMEVTLTRFRCPGSGVYALS